MLKFINRPREGENTFLIICVLAESATWPVCLFLICQFISFFILLFFSKRSSKFSMELYQSKSEKFRRRCWQVVEWFKSSQFTFGKQSIFITRQHGFYPKKPRVDYIILTLSRTCFFMYLIGLPIHFQCCFILNFFLTLSALRTARLIGEAFATEQ